MKLYIVSEDPKIDADVVIHTGRTINIRGRGKTRLPDCSSVEFAKQFYAKLRRSGLKLAIDMSDEVPSAPAAEAPEPPKDEEQKKEEIPAPETPSEPETKEEVKEPEQNEAPTQETPAPAMESRADLLKMTKPQLIEKAKQMGIIDDLYPLSKSAIVDRILA